MQKLYQFKKETPEQKINRLKKQETEVLDKLKNELEKLFEENTEKKSKIESVIQSKFIKKTHGHYEENLFIALFLLKEFDKAEEYYNIIIKKISDRFLRDKITNESNEVMTFYQFYKNEKYFNTEDEEQIFTRFRKLLTLEDALLHLKQDPQNIKQMFALNYFTSLNQDKPEDLSICKSLLLMRNFDEGYRWLNKLKDEEKVSFLKSTDGLKKILMIHYNSNEILETEWHKIKDHYENHLNFRLKLRVLGITKEKIKTIFCFNILYENSEINNENLFIAFLLIKDIDAAKKYTKDGASELLKITKNNESLLDYLIIKSVYKDNDLKKLLDEFNVNLTFTQTLKTFGISKKEMSKIFKYGFVTHESECSNQNIFIFLLLKGDFKNANEYYNKLDKNNDFNDRKLDLLRYLIRNNKFKINDIEQLKNYSALFQDLLDNSDMFFDLTIKDHFTNGNGVKDTKYNNKCLIIIEYLAPKINFCEKDELGNNLLHLAMKRIGANNYSYAFQIFQIFQDENPSALTKKNKLGQTPKDILISNFIKYTTPEEYEREKYIFLDEKGEAIYSDIHSYDQAKKFENKDQKNGKQIC